MTNIRRFIWPLANKGVRVPDSKLSKDKQIEDAKIPEIATIYLQQHIGAPCEPLVKVGDYVSVGEKIGDSKSFVSAPVHSSVSGTVLSIEEKIHPSSGLKRDAIVIESDNKDKWIDRKKINDISDFKKDELLQIIRESGLVGLGGAAFPTHVKLSPKNKIDTLILNGCECEPYITSDHRLMVEEGEKIVKGAEIFAKILDAENVLVAIEDNKPDAILTIDNIIKDYDLKNFKVLKTETKYPHGFEKTLIFLATGREVPLVIENRAGLPADVGVVVQNVGTAKAAYDAVYEGKPIIDRVITVTGDVKEQKNLLVRIGTKFSELIDFCGGFNGTIEKVVMGGPMMGICQNDLDVSTIKATNCLLIFGDGMTGYKKRDIIPKDIENPCIRCGNCVKVCPVNLIPTDLAKYARARKFNLCKENNIDACMGCGSCSFVCPSKIELAQLISWAKNEARNIK
ncbi:MAG TPA: electron transport complex subunit RsxC [Halobacteria archaeon]|nr:electron transport complex subunit RsxC [Halobacteria archaeon]